MLVCLEDNSCFGFETYYTTDPITAKLIYQIDLYAFFEDSTLSASIPTAGFYNDFGHYLGFSDHLFYT